MVVARCDRNWPVSPSAAGEAAAARPAGMRAWHSGVDAHRRGRAACARINGATMAALGIAQVLAA